MKIADITEAPIADIHHAGDFSKNSSFRDPKDRILVTHPMALQNLKKKFAGTPHEFVFFFVNTPEGRHHTEVGEVNLDWLADEMPKFYAQFAQTKIPEDAITIIFTNNSGAERFNMTPWIIGHRIGHAFNRAGRAQWGERGSTPAYIWNEIRTTIIGTSARILEECYSLARFSNVSKEDDLNRYNGGYYDENKSKQMRNLQLMLTYFWYEIGTMRSARQRNLRDYFEFFYELFAQYLIQGGIKFNPPPQKVVTGYSYGRPGYTLLRSDATELCQEYLNTMATTLDYHFHDFFSWAAGRIFVM